MDQREAAFAKQLMATFKVEAEEHLKVISDGLLTLEKNPQEKNLEVIETIYREAHNLKGAARAVDLCIVQDICQNLENILSDLKNGKKSLSAELFDQMYNLLDAIQRYIFKENKSDQEQLLETLVLKQEPMLSVETPIVEKLSPSNEKKNSEFSSTENIKTKTIRLNQKKLDHLMQEVEEMLIIKLITGQRFNYLQQILSKFKLWEKKWSRLQKDLRHMRQVHEGEIKEYIPSKEFLEFIEHQPVIFKNLCEELQTLTKNTAQDARLVGGMIDSLLDNTKKVLMQPFSSLFDQFPRMVRDLSHKLGKEIQLIVQGGDIEVDKRILDEMKDPLIHLIRNCIDHGIDTPEERSQLKKNKVGRIILTATQTGGSTVEICIADDGKGLDLQKIKSTAISQGILSQKEANDLSDNEAARLIFKSGISTSPIITELSGRGLGLGIVMEKVEKLGGNIHIDSKLNVGTTFQISLPLTIATFRGVHIQVENLDFIVPSHHLNCVLRIKPADIKTVEGTNTINIKGKNVAYVDLKEVLGINVPMGTLTQKKFVYIIVIQTLEAIIALGVDHIFNEQEVFIKGLGKQLVKVKNVAAATIMEWGKVISILDPFDLVNTVKTLTKKTQSPVLNDNEIRKKTILIAEDSMTARLLLKNILDSAGYAVKTAVDGAEALSILKTESIDLLLSDVEMPRLNGFKLAEKVRALDKFKNLPIVLCTSRGSREDKEHGIEVGANAYIEKSNFAQSHLLDIIQKLI